MIKYQPCCCIVFPLRALQEFLERLNRKKSFLTLTSSMTLKHHIPPLTSSIPTRPSLSCMTSWSSTRLTTSRWERYRWSSDILTSCNQSHWNMGLITFLSVVDALELSKLTSFQYFFIVIHTETQALNTAHMITSWPRRILLGFRIWGWSAALSDDPCSPYEHLETSYKHLDLQFCSLYSVQFHHDENL